MIADISSTDGSTTGVLSHGSFRIDRGSDSSATARCSTCLITLNKIT